MRRALEETVIEGVNTTVPLQNLIMYNRDFLRGDYDTGFMVGEQVRSKPRYRCQKCGFTAYTLYWHCPS